VGIVLILVDLLGVKKKLDTNRIDIVTFQHHAIATLWYLLDGCRFLFGWAGERRSTV
jgi:hypothetical protein